MTALLDRISLRGEAARDVLAVWLTITAALTYLDVPLRHSQLFAANIVLQASLGTLVITRLLRSVAPSLLLLCGPGLILGGALSFAVFQIAGRGQVGLIVTTLFGATAVIALLMSHRPYQSLESRWWMLGQLLGLAALAMSSEFPEMLPIVILFFALSFPYLQVRSSHGLLSLTFLMLTAIVVYISFRSRQEFWWAITDDYMFLETVKNHLLHESPFMPWGVTSFAHYHWLPYGWAGLLDLASGKSDPFVTLSQVMPITYSLALAASLGLIARELNRTHASSNFLLPVWTIVAVTKLDWAATGTAGTYAVLASVALLAVWIMKLREFFSVLLLLLIFAVILTLTKFTSTFAMIVVAVVMICRHVERRSSDMTWRASWGVLVRVMILPLVVLAVWVSSESITQRYKFVGVNSQLGQLATAGATFASLMLALNQLWLWVSIAAVLWVTLSKRELQHFNVRFDPGIFLIAAVAGIMFDVFITANSDNHKYLSGPMYFLASLAFFTPELLCATSDRHSKTEKVSYAIAAIMVLAGWSWSTFGLHRVVWDALGRIATPIPNLGVELAKFFTSDGRFLAAALALLGLLFAMVRGLRISIVTRPLMASLVIITVLNHLKPASESYKVPVSRSELSAYLGTPVDREIGEWLRINTSERDLIATNHLFGDWGGGVRQQAMAAWSQREFLVLGYGLEEQNNVARSNAIQLSRSFADQPDSVNCHLLSSARVRWFVIDYSLTTQRDWSMCGKERFRVANLSVLQLQS